MVEDERALNRLLAGIGLFLLVSCGGGGSSGPTSPPSQVLPSLSIADSSIVETDSGTQTLDFNVTLSSPSANTVSAEWATADGTATAGEDYQQANGTLTIPAGQTATTVSVIINGDRVDESNETFTVSLSNAQNARIVRGTATGTILAPNTNTVGLSTRPDNQTCVAPDRPIGSTQIRTVEAYPNLPNLNQPTKLILEPVSDPRWFVLQKPGQIIVFDPDNATALQQYLSVSVRTNSEGGLLGMAFHPDYPSTPEIFLSYTINHTNPNMRSVISRVILDDVNAPSPIGAGSVEQRLLLVDQDFDNHNGGDIAFGPDGYLYIGLGDGGDAGDPLNRAQDTTRLLGSFLRIDVTGPSVSFPANPYAIPPGNPFAGQPKCGPGANANNCPEIYAWGMRNPWRWSFDGPTQNLWAADVGQNAFEEVSLITLGGNFGWRCFEGPQSYNPSGCNGTYIEPVGWYPHSEGNSITGGYVYRGSAIPGLIGSYVFADYGSGRIWSLSENSQGGYTRTLLEDTNRGPTSFGVDAEGELYLTDINSGRVIKLEPSGGPVTDTIPARLSATGCVDPNNTTQPYAGLLPYDLNAPFWSDGAVKDRYIGLPNGTQIDIQDGDWIFPSGTVIVKNFRLNNRLVETRHLMRHPDGVWAGYTYEWNAAQTDATRVIGGKVVDIGGQDWIFPSESQCSQCHTAAANFVLGAETAQLNKDFTYPSTGTTANQIDTIDHIMMLLSSPGPAASLPAYVDPGDSSADLNLRARAYLHTNCSSCHQPGGPTPTDLDLRFQTDLSDTRACNAPPQAGNLGLGNGALIIAPGSANLSILLERMERRDAAAMPPIGSAIVDRDGAALIRQWINALSDCR